MIAELIKQLIQSGISIDILSDYPGSVYLIARRRDKEPFRCRISIIALNNQELQLFLEETIKYYDEL